MFNQKKKKEKYSLEEYKKIKEANAKKRFRFKFYPWPVSIILSIPLIFFVIIMLAYVFYVKGLTDN